LYDDVGTAGNMFGHELRDQARIEIVDIAGFGGDNNSDGFSLIEGSLGLGTGSWGQYE
jgi:hypothetical protein